MESVEVHVAENKERTRQEVIDRVDDLLRERLEERFSQEEFHNPHHSEEVDANSRRILGVIHQIDPSLLTEDDNLIRHTAALGHDVVILHGSIAQRFIKGPTTDDMQLNPMYGQRIRQRGYEPTDLPKLLWSTHYDHGNQTLSVETVGNEKASADETEQVVREVDPEGEIYTQEVIDGMKDAIRATFPEVSFDSLKDEHLQIKDGRNVLEYKDIEPYLGPEGKAINFKQKYLTPESPLPTFAIALGDLAYCGLYTSGEFTKRGNAEFRETRDLTRYEIENGVTKINIERKKEIIKDMLNWMKSQIQFVLWQKVNTLKNIDQNKAIAGSAHAEKIRQALRKQYSEFDTNVVAAIERYQKFIELEKATLDVNDFFIALAEDFGYVTNGAE